MGISPASEAPCTLFWPRKGCIPVPDWPILPVKSAREMRLLALSVPCTCCDIPIPQKIIERSAVALLFLSDDQKYLQRIKDTDIAMPTIIGNVNEVIDTVGTLKEIGVKELIVPDFTLGTLIGADQIKQDIMEKFVTQVARVYQ